MKTPEKIKKGLECMRTNKPFCAECAYVDCNLCEPVIAKDALACIQQLESTYSQVSKALCGKENATLDEVLQAVRQVKADASRKDDTIRNLTELLNAANDEAAKYKRERDAAVADLKSVDEKYESLKSMIDDVTFNHEPYGLYLDFREAADAMVEYEHADVWRGVCPENTEVQDDD